jgi:hypothetical protein
VEKEKNEILIRYEVERRKCLELVFSCCQGAINYLRVCRLRVISRLLIWIAKVVVSIPRVSIEDDFNDFATEYLSLRRKREMWASMGDK